MFTQLSPKPFKAPQSSPSKRTLSCCAAALFVLFCGTIQPAFAQSLVDTPFTRQVQKNFSLWDKDGNGVISAPEVDAGVTDPRFRGEASAALASLKVALRSVKGKPLPPFDRNYFSLYARSPLSRAAVPATVSGSLDDTPDSSATLTDPAPKSAAPPPFDRYFQRSLSRLRTTGPEIFLSNDPRLDHIRQHSQSDCFFLAVVGAIIIRDPAILRGMIVPRRDGSYTVTFPGRAPLPIPALTDTQICLYGSTSSGARWLMILEEAFGRLSNELRPEAARHEISSDYYLVGGSPTTCMRLLTGHENESILFRPRQGDAMPTREEIEPKLAPLRTALTDAFRDHRLVTAGTNTGKLPPGITPRHSYTVLGYDPASDTIRIWNPHRNNPRRRSAPGLETGYPTREGIFTVPTEEFARIFNRVTWEKIPAEETKR